MRRISVLLLVFVLSGCGIHTQETVDLSWAIADYASRNDVLIQKAVNGEALTQEQAQEMSDNSEAIARTSKTLAEILGEPSKVAIASLSNTGE